MPSQSYKIYRDTALKDIEKIFSNYEELKGVHRGKRALDHLFRSGVLLLAAAFESYIEDVIVESVNILSDQLIIEDLPVSVKQKIIKCVTKEKDELAPILLIAGDNWRGYYIQIAEKETLNLNTPKTKQIDILMKDLLGVEKISDNLELENIVDKDGNVENELNHFIMVRGEIAHRLKGEVYLKQDVFKSHVSMIGKVVKQIDKYLQIYLMNLIRRAPWRDTY